MAYKWRATFSFDYPLLDLPVDIGDIRLYPAPPELDLAPHAIHCYEFETSALDRDAQQEAEKMYLARLAKLAELSVLSPYYTEVAFTPSFWLMAVARPVIHPAESMSDSMENRTYHLGSLRKSSDRNSLMQPSRLSSFNPCAKKFASRFPEHYAGFTGVRITEFLLMISSSIGGLPSIAFIPYLTLSKE